MLIQPVAGPGRARDVDEGAALRRRFELALARGHEGGGELRRSRARPAVLARIARAMRLHQEHARRRSPMPSVSIAASQSRSDGCIGDVAGLHRPFDAAGIGKRADRKGRRQPGHQPVQRRRLLRPSAAARRPALICGHEHGCDRGGARDRDDHARCMVVMVVIVVTVMTVIVVTIVMAVIMVRMVMAMILRAP